MSEYHDPPGSRKEKGHLGARVSAFWKRVLKSLRLKYRAKIPIQICRAASLYFWIWKHFGRFTLTDHEIARLQGCDEATIKRLLAILRSAGFLRSKMEYDYRRLAHVRVLIPLFSITGTPFETLEALALAKGLITPLAAEVPVPDLAPSPAPTPEVSPSPAKVPPSDRGKVAEDGKRCGISPGMIFGAMKRYGFEVVRAAVGVVQQNLKSGQVREVSRLFWAACKSGWKPNEYDEPARRAPEVVTASQDTEFMSDVRRREKERAERDRERKERIEKMLRALSVLERNELLKRARLKIAEQLPAFKRREFIERTQLDDRRVLAEAGNLLLSGSS